MTINSKLKVSVYMRMEIKWVKSHAAVIQSEAVFNNSNHEVQRHLWCCPIENHNVSGNQTGNWSLFQKKLRWNPSTISGPVENRGSSQGVLSTGQKAVKFHIFR